MGKEKKKNLKIAVLTVALVAVLLSGVLFMGAVSGWFDKGAVRLDAEYYCKEECKNELILIDAEEYNKLVAEEKSFAIVIDQGGCNTAERLKGYALDYGREAGVEMYRIMISEMKKTSMYETVKFSPSFAVIFRGEIWAYLRADSDDDAILYNDYDAFYNWARKYIQS